MLRKTAAMHELSIAYNLVEIAANAAKNAGAQHVKMVHLRLGLLSGIVKESLLFSFDIAAEGTLIAGARLEVEELPVIIHCAECGADTTLDTIQRFACGTCGALTGDIRQGKELALDYLELETEDAAENLADSAGRTEQE